MPGSWTSLRSFMFGNGAWTLSGRFFSKEGDMGPPHAEMDGSLLSQCGADSAIFFSFSLSLSSSQSLRACCEVMWYRHGIQAAAAALQLSISSLFRADLFPPSDVSFFSAPCYVELHGGA